MTPTNRRAVPGGPLELTPEASRSTQAERASEGQGPASPPPATLGFGEGGRIVGTRGPPNPVRRPETLLRARVRRRPRSIWGESRGGGAPPWKNRPGSSACPVHL